MEEAFSRTALQLGEDAVEKLAKARVAVFGIGGVGGYAVEALARSGVGTLDLIDDDKVAPSNLNRQIIATHHTLGQYKVDAAKERILSINPNAVVNTHCTFYLPQTAAEFDLSVYDYIIDAIDTVAGKIALIEAAKAANTPIISCMGAGNKLDAHPLQMLADILNQRELHVRRIRHRKTLFAINGMQTNGLIVEDRERHRATVAYQIDTVLAGRLVSHKAPGTRARQAVFKLEAGTDGILSRIKTATIGTDASCLDNNAEEMLQQVELVGCQIIEIASAGNIWL